jgi:hypothetical protein
MIFYNLEVLIIRHLRRVLPRPEIFLFIRKKALSLKQADLRGMFKKTSKSVCTSTTAVPPDPLSPSPSTSSATKNAEEHRRYRLPRTSR